MKFYSYFFFEGKDYLSITLKFHESVVHLKLEEQVVASDVVTDFNIPAHSKGLLQRKSEFTDFLYEKYSLLLLHNFYRF
jgi:hypothetical protein